MSARRFDLVLTLALRRGATLVEFAIVAPVLFLLLFGLLIGGGGVFRYQQVAYLAREASRFASLHGAAYHAETGNPAATQADITQFCAQKATGLDLSKLTCTVTWNTSNAQFHTVVVNGNTVQVANTVTVTVSYTWIPEAYVGQKTLSSTSVAVMSF
jgi:Flp pilus assembly protein TadG